VTSSTTTLIEGIPAILLEVVDLEDPVEVGKEETYVIMATNQGSADGTNISISCILEPNARFLSSKGPTEAMIKGDTIVLGPIKKLAPNAKATWRVNVKAVKNGDVRFKVAMTSDQIERAVEETEATTFYQ